MHSVFISYSTKDQTQAETVRSILEKNGIVCWMAPRDIPGGSNYTREIPIAIRGCQVFVLILSQNAQNSPWVLKELDSAVNCGKVILPFMLEDCQLNEEFNFLLTGAQRYSAYQKKMEAMETLINRIRAITAENPVQEQEMPAPAEEPAPVEAPKEAPEVKQAYFGLAQCPACGSDEVEELTKKIGRYTLVEHLTWVLVPVMAMAGFGVMTMVAGLLATIFYFSEAAETIGIIGMILGFVGGGIWGNKLSYEWVRRMRVRKHIGEHPRRCKRCRKVFLVENT